MIVVHEYILRNELVKNGLSSGYASELAKEVSSDPTLSRVLFKMKNGGE